MYMKLKDGKSKVLTLSYDDATVHDIRLIEIMNKHGIKGTFNVNTGMYFAENETRQEFRGRLKLSEAKSLYINSGHEVAVHALNHPFLERLKDDEIIYEIMEDRKNIEKEYSVITRGMAYPYGTYDKRVVDIISKCGICYSRTVKSSEEFVFPENWLEFNPTCHHNNPHLMKLAKRFVEETPGFDSDNWLFYLWGHSYEFSNDDNWNIIEEFAELAGNKDDIWYATNIEVYDYVKAYEALQASVNKKLVYNPSVIDVWFVHEGKKYCIHGGETLSL